MFGGQRFLFSFLLLGFLASRLHADPPVSIGAELASTLISFHIENGVVRLEFEIGSRSEEAFADLLTAASAETSPDGRREALDRFLAEGVIIRGPEGLSLPGQLLSVKRQPRVDRPSNFPPTNFQQARSDDVIYVEIECQFDGRPTELTLAPPLSEGKARTDLGFIVFHQGVQVIDFRFLSQPETLSLDWKDPWHSRFENRNLTRHHKDPAMSFLYVEPLGIRHEVLIRPLDLEAWIDLGLADRDWLEIEQQEALKTAIATFLAERCPITVDGEAVTPTVERSQFLRCGLNGFEVIDPPTRIRTTQAIVGVIFAHPTLDWPDEVTVTWNLFGHRFQRVPATCIDEAGPLTFNLSADDRVSRWRNFLTDPTRLEIEALPRLSRARGPAIPLLSLAAAIMALGLFFRGRGDGLWRPRRLAPVILCLVLAAATWPFMRVSLPIESEEITPLQGPEAEEYAAALLRNVYLAFHYRDESRIYDTLARSVAGDHLDETYDQIYRSILLQNQGGARTRVDRVDVREAEIESSADGPGLELSCTWEVEGTVDHWGHAHRRRHRYRAVLVLGELDQEFKITDMQLVTSEAVSAQPL